MSGFGIYPDIYELEEAGTGGESHIKMSLHSFPFSKSGPESPVIRWFLDKKMVITAFRKVPQKQQQMQILQTLSYVCT